MCLCVLLVRCVSNVGRLTVLLVSSAAVVGSQLPAHYPLTQGCRAKRQTPHLFHNTFTQSHTLVRGQRRCVRRPRGRAQQTNPVHQRSTLSLASLNSGCLIRPHSITPGCLLAAAANRRVVHGHPRSTANIAGSSREYKEKE